MQSAEFLVNKHDDQILEIKDSLSNITTKMAVMIQEHAHLSEKVHEILDAVKSFSHSNYTIREMEKNLTALQIKVQALEEAAKQENDKLLLLEQKSNRLNNLMIVLKEYWPIILVILAAIGALLDWAYKVDPRG